MSEERRLIYHWRLWITIGRGFERYNPLDFEQCLYKFYVADGEVR